MASFAEWQSDCSSDLLQNCDLPPPLKLFSPLDKEIKKSQPMITRWDNELEAMNFVEDASLRRALQLSQSRAREAEKKAMIAEDDGEKIGRMFLEDSLRLSAHRQWVKLLDIEVASLKNKRRKLDGDRDVDGADDALSRLCLALALCLGIGFVIGRYKS